MFEAIKDNINREKNKQILIELSLDEENRDVACNNTGLVLR